jgi:hypothetical protein
MKAAPTGIHADEQQARLMILAQAIETSDAQGKLLSAAEREDIDRLALQSARAAAAGAPVNVEDFLRERAQQVLNMIENRNPALASLRERRPWTQWLTAAAPLAAVALGAATDRIANPHRVDLLSLPLLAILGWNLVMYCALLFSYRLRRPGRDRVTFASLPRWAVGLRGWQRRPGQLQANVTALFLRHWYGASAALRAQRWRKTLHLAAAGWALGVALSLFTRGLVVEYRVGWESTFLNAEQVHAILRVLLMPAMALFPFEPFSVQDIAGLQFSNGNGALAGARWVYLYATLLAVVVILPRLLLALFAGWRERMLSGRVWLSLTDPYHQRLLHMLNPTRVQLGLIAVCDEDRNALLGTLRRRAQGLYATDGAHNTIQTLLRTSSGDELFIANMPVTGHAPPLPGTMSAPVGWAGRTFDRLLGTRSAGPVPAVDRSPAAGQHDSDVVLLVVRDASASEAALSLLRGVDKPGLVLVDSPASAEFDREAEVVQWRARVKALGPTAEVLGFDSFARCWVQDPILLDAIARCMPDHKKEGFNRLAAAWQARNRERLALSMRAIARQLVDAASEVEKVRGMAPSVVRLIKPSDRQASAQARKDAMATVIGRLHRSARATHASLLRLHGIDDVAGLLLEDALEEKFNIQAPINAREAGIAGAATGAGTGAAVDLVTGGLTLGAAAALGALIGGGAAFAGAAWNNRASPAGAATVQLSDEMLLALLVATLLHYLSITHFDGEPPAHETSDMAQRWKNKVTAAVARRKKTLADIWVNARKPEHTAQATEDLGQALQTSASEVLHELYPATPPV